jgi:RNA polymerase sigma-70 factor, ECF subfamily
MVTDSGAAILGASPRVEVEPVSLEDLYSAHFDFVWRSLRRLGVPEAAVEDAAHDVFEVVYRRWSEFRHDSSVKTWLFSIALRVAQNSRRYWARRRSEQLDAETADARETAPDELSARAENARLAYRLLEELAPEKRAVFILAELEQLPAPEIARALEIPVNTVYSRLRAARREFEAALGRYEAQGTRRQRWTS